MEGFASELSLPELKVIYQRSLKAAISVF